MEARDLPSGWRREEVVRKSGLSAGKTDVYYYSPDGRKVRSKPMLARILGRGFDLSSFDFRTGKMMQSAMRKRVRQDTNLVLPIRQTASIFKQPVTVVKNRPESKTRTDLKHGTQEQPRQLFWEKRLQGLYACDTSQEKFSSLELPHTIQGVGPGLSTENMLQSIAAALHNNTRPITGQNASKGLLQKNPAISINTEQPLIQAVVVTDHDIKKQEVKVTEARKRLEHAITSLKE
ncbi:hypothetical protein NP493_145g04000 [Ridgeia piscesae]|uniref:MBD domain-containing protein n=1 Tax=Ridgeia piscesae TaxID=27915 RepID=A0AAD9P4Z7_RIDPI|nr:hypothetical protein NP493_145g04000 [Ridgeia piscesae]